MTTHLPHSNSALYTRLLGYVMPHWKAFALAVVGMVGTAATEPVFPAIMKFLLDHGFKTDNQRLVWLIPLSIVGLFLVRGVLSFVTSYLMTWISTRLVCDLRRELFAHILVLPTQTFHDQSSGSRIVPLPSAYIPTSAGWNRRAGSFTSIFFWKMLKRDLRILAS